MKLRNDSASPSNLCISWLRRERSPSIGLDRRGAVPSVSNRTTLRRFWRPVELTPLLHAFGQVIDGETDGWKLFQGSHTLFFCVIQKFLVWWNMLTVREVALKLNISVGAVYKAINAGELECHRFGKTIRISVDQFECFLSCSALKPPIRIPFNRALKHL